MGPRGAIKIKAKIDYFKINLGKTKNSTRLGSANVELNCIKTQDGT